MNKFTADTVTDEQIRDCGADVETTENAIAVDPNWPGGQRYWARVYRAARARCAEILNQRSPKEGK